ncbi:hypothetical protein MVLG_00992 [Microbotryum lychnidis-dioicae p1A1 Lamole]|uniref:Uncharacterized protein n=1 Tax=Microbotryum lychnidis-dioicae (strain p1A1 Lamole / MvSl-1064) TaxID=683840 RepID=U5H0R9_USTV1|nr:hypothetical protein MVLG_00992 [Microbotryum lychnidis-dioicae p1A1 Lamole]|eukprot:KDE08896.1 hypothetical protein MVLG_00992 [Microbotryum lychnidis-dioicae p1A1 Lamole]
MTEVAVVAHESGSLQDNAAGNSAKHDHDVPARHDHHDADRTDHDHAHSERPPRAGLTATRLQAFTLAHPPSPRKTVQSYLLSLQRPFEDPGLEPLSSSPAYIRDRIPRSPPVDRIETALTLHPYDELKGRKQKKRIEAEAETEGGKKIKKKSLVAALQPRFSNQHTVQHGSSPTLPSTSKQVLKAKGTAERRTKTSRFARDDSSSPELVARIDQASNRQNEQPEPGSSRPRPEAVATQDEPLKVTKTSRQARKENEPLVESKHKSKSAHEAKNARDSKLDMRKGKGKAETTFEEQEEQEAEERLRARRERRRAKALIVKDRSKSATAVGTAAAAKVVAAAEAASSRKPKRITPSTSDESLLPRAAPTSKRHKKTRPDDAHGFVVEIPRAKNLGASRLTLQPLRKLGVFKKGAASGKVNVRRPLPDLPFSEHAFLDGPQPSNASPSDMSSIGPLSAPKQRLPKASKSKKSKGKQSSRQARPESDQTSSSSEPAPVIVAPRKAAALPKGARRLDVAPTPLRNPLGPSRRLSNSQPSSSNASMLSPAASAVADTTSLHSAYSLRLRRERVTKMTGMPTPSNLGSAPVIDTSAYWSQAANVTTNTTTKKSRPSNDPVSKEVQASSPIRDSSSADFIQPATQVSNILTPSSSSIERLIQDCAMPLQKPISSDDFVHLPFDQAPTLEEGFEGSTRWRSPALAAHEGQLVGSVMEQQVGRDGMMMYASKEPIATTHNPLVQTLPSSSISAPPRLLGPAASLSDETLENMNDDDDEQTPVFFEPTVFSPRRTRSHPRRAAQQQNQDDSIEFHEAMRKFWPRSKC